MSTHSNQPTSRRYHPQSRPTPTQDESAAVIEFLQERLLATIREGAANEVSIARRLLALDGFLGRYQTAAHYAAHPPYGLERAWELVAATLAAEAADLAAVWADHPEFNRAWLR